MSLLVLGLLLFLGSHSVRIVADDWRTAVIARMGDKPWKGLYSLAALAGFLCLVWGFGMARAAPIPLWSPPAWTRHLTALLMLLSFVLLVASYVPGNRIKAAIGHPMVAAVKVWALAHLIANGLALHVVLFGAFLVWAIADFAASRRRDRRLGVHYPVASGPVPDLLVLVLGVVLWWAFARYGHVWLIGVSPLGGMSGAS